MKIAFLAGANSIHTVRWVNAMVERKHKVHLLTAHPPGINPISKDVEIHFLAVSPPSGYFMNLLQVRRILRKIKPDFLHTHFASGYGTLSRLVKFHPTILSVWGSDVYEFPERNKFTKYILKENLKSADIITSTSFVMKKQTEKFLTKSANIYVVPFGVDLKKFTPLREPFSNNEIKIGIIKSLEKKYGIEYLIKGFSILLSKLQDTKNKELIDKLKLVIIGKGSIEKKLKKLASDLCISSKANFIGAIPHSEVPKWLNELDIFCAPSVSESFGVAVIEASACCRPVIVSNIGGFPEVIQNKQTGLLIPPKDPHSLSRALLYLISNQDIAKNMGIEGRKFVEKNYNWQNNVCLMEKIYLKTILLKLNPKADKS